MCRTDIRGYIIQISSGCSSFRFWSLSTIQRIISKLEKEGLIIKGKYNRSKFNNTVWYRIDYEKLEELMPSDEFEELRRCQFDRRE